MSSVDVRSIQCDEVIALRNIFGKEFKLVRPKNIKKKYESPFLYILISVDLLSCKESNVSIKLNFDCSADYPHVIPKISISDVSNLSIEKQQDLLSQIKLKSMQLIGVPMIHNLVEEAREIIIKQFEEFKSDNVIVMNAEENISNEDKQSELKLRLLRERRNSVLLETKYFDNCLPSCQYFKGIIEFDHCLEKGNMQVYKGVCDKQHRTKSIDSSLQLTFNTFEGFHIMKGCNVKIHQITLPSLTKKRSEHLKMNWLPKLEEDFSLLYKLSHPNLLSYLGFRYHFAERTMRKKKLVDVFIQYITPSYGGMKLSTLCELDTKDDFTNDGSSKNRLSIHKIKSYLKNVLDVVLYLHEKCITNIKINMDSIIMDKSQQLKICYYHIGKRFEELKVTEDQKDKCEDQPAVSCVKRGSKRHDIIKVGKLAKKLFFFGVPEIEIDEADMPSDLIDFISCLESNIEDVKHHPFLCVKGHAKNSDYNHKNIDLEKDLSRWKIFEKSSRIPKEFELICKLGEGTFGDVVKVKNIYDNQYYAIKRVRLNAIKKKAARTIKEVQLLSSLNHENIVRYFASWSEEIQNSDFGNQPLSSQNAAESSSTRNNVSNAKSILKPEIEDSGLIDLLEKKNSVAFSENFKFSHLEERSRHFDLESYSDSDSESESSDESENNDNNQLKFPSPPSVEICFEQSKWSSFKEEDIKNAPQYFNDSYCQQIQKYKIEKYLMIQMELCEGPCNTLQKCIEEQKLYLNEKLIWRFIREIVSGLDHIHSKNMIHRDLKPGNIFLDSQKRVKIGDLGLAMNMNPKIADLVNQGEIDEKNLSTDIEKGPVGTVMYICPEMRAHSFYTNKADLYSLGIIIFEMCHKPFNTGSERFYVLSNLRRPEIVFPDEKQFKIKDSFKQLIASLLNHDPSQRPGASEILKSNIIPPPEKKELELRQFLVDVTKSSSSNLYKLLLKELFNQTYSKIGCYELFLLDQSPFKNFLSDSKPSQIDEGSFNFFSLKRLIHRHIESVFVSHGAIEFFAPLLSPKLSPNQSNAFTLMDSEGIVVNLPDNLRINFANFLLNNSINVCKRYAIGPIYQQQERYGNHPRELIEAAFDTVTEGDNNNKIVEVLYILHQIFSKIINFERVTLNLEINHTGLFYGVMKYYKIPDEIHHKILMPFEDHTPFRKDFLDTDEFRNCTILNDNQLSNLKLILRHNNRLEDLLKYCKIFQNKAHENECCDSIIKALNELQLIEKKLCDFQSPCCFSISVRPNLVPLRSLYQGFVFQIILKVQERFFDLIKPTQSKSTKTTIRYLRNPKKLCIGGEYSSYMRKGHCALVTENGDNNINHISAIGTSIDFSTLLQCLYSIEQLLPSNIDMENQSESVMNSVVSVVVQYDVENDKMIRELLSKLWALGIPTELYDKDEFGEEYISNKKISILIKFNKSEKRFNIDNRIYIKKNDFKGIGLEQIFAEDIKTIDTAVELICKELKKSRNNFITRMEREHTCIYQKQYSDSAQPESNVDYDSKKTFYSKSENPTNRYMYKFISTKDGKYSSSVLNLSYFVETSKHMQSLNQKYSDLDLFQIQLIGKFNNQLSTVNKFFQGRFPNPLYCIIAEISYAKCCCLAEEVSLKSLKDNFRLCKLLEKIESSRNNAFSEKQWKDVLSRIWEALQNAIKEKIYRVLIYSQIDENFVVLEIK